MSIPPPPPPPPDGAAASPEGGHVVPPPATAADARPMYDTVPPYASSPDGGAVPLEQIDVGMSMDELSSRLREVGLVSPLRPIGIALLAYVAALLTATVSTVLTYLIGRAGSGGTVIGTGGALRTDTLSSAFSPGDLLGLPVQIVQLAVFGKASVEVASEELSTSIHLGYLPAVVTAVLVLTCWFGARRIERGRTTPMPGLLANAIAAGLTTALVSLLLALLIPWRIPMESIGYLSFEAIRVSAAGLSSFFGMFFLVALALIGGGMSRRVRPSWWPLIKDLPRAARFAGAHALLLAGIVYVAALAILTLMGIAQGRVPQSLWFLASLPLNGGAVLSYVVGLIGLSAVVVTVDAPESALLADASTTETYSIFSLPWYVAPLGLLTGLLVLIAVSVVWHRDRRRVPNNALALLVSWTALPAMYFVGGIVLLVLARFAMETEIGLGDYGTMQTTVTAGLGWWTPFMMLVAGVLVELSSRVVAPILSAVLPRASRRTATTVGTAPWAGASRASGPSTTPPPPPAATAPPGPPPPPAAPAHPTSSIPQHGAAFPSAPERSHGAPPPPPPFKEHPDA